MNKIIKDITRKNVQYDIPSYEEPIKGKSKLEKIDICNEYVKMVEQAQNNVKDCLLNQTTGTNQGEK